MHLIGCRMLCMCCGLFRSRASRTTDVSTLVLRSFKLMTNNTLCVLQTLQNTEVRAARRVVGALEEQLSDVRDRVRGLERECAGLEAAVQVPSRTSHPDLSESTD